MKSPTLVRPSRSTSTCARSEYRPRASSDSTGTSNGMTLDVVVPAGRAGTFHFATVRAADVRRALLEGDLSTNQPHGPSWSARYLRPVEIEADGERSPPAIFLRL